MDRSNSVSSTSSSNTNRSSSTEPFAYQTRLLERTSSLLRTNSQSTGRGNIASPTVPSSPTTRRWTPSHRVGNSIDSVRGKWEERARAEAALEGQISGSGSKESVSSDDTYASTIPTSSGPSPEASPGPKLLRDWNSFASSPTKCAEPLSHRITPPHLKRHTLPAPIFASPLSPNTTGVTVEAPDEHDVFATPTHRIRLPVTASLKSPAATGTKSFEKFVAPSPIIDKIDPPTPNTTGDSVASVDKRDEGKFSTSTQGIRTPTTGTKRFDNLAFPRPIGDKAEATLSSRARRSVDFESILSSSTRSNEPSRVIPALSSTLSSQSSTLSSIPSNNIGTRLRPASLYGQTNVPRPLSPEKLKFPPTSTAASYSAQLFQIPPSPDLFSSNSYRTPPASPAVPSAPPLSSVMSPTPYRSLDMANKKAGNYGEGLGRGRKLGRHLPRIASGDGNERPEDEAPPPVPPIPPPKADPGGTAEEKARLSRLERREKRMREWERDLQIETPTRRRTVDVDELFTPVATSANDVAGIPGRLRLSKDVSAAPSPLPSSRINRGLWADTQRHLLQVYEYLCHVGEAQQWIEGCLDEELGFGVVEMEDGLRNGVVLAKLVRVFQGVAVVRRIHEAPKLDFRHSDNINYFFNFVRHVGLPECFIFELTDLYDKKNIPKVIYCIHALSHLLSRRGMAERIGNLLGQLKFSDDQLQQTEKGLKAAGVAMPNFGNVGRELAKEINEEPEVEVETEDERRDRLLLENEDSITAMQTIARGFLVRKAQVTQRVRIRLAERHLPRLQARCRGVMTRQRVQQERKQQYSLTPWAVAFQALARGVIVRRQWRSRMTRIRGLVIFIVKAQAQSRGVIQRRRFAKMKAALSKSTFSILKLQSIARAQLARKTHKQVHKTLEQVHTMRSVVSMQAASRGTLARRKVQGLQAALERTETSIVCLQAHVRGVLTRRRVGAQLAKLDDSAHVVVRIQAAARCYLARKRLLNLIRGLRRATPAIVGLQARARATLQRKYHEDMNKVLAQVHVIKSVGGFQALARAALVRKRHVEQSKQLGFVAPDVVGIQAAARGALVRQVYLAWRDHLRSSHDEATMLQALMLGVLQRRKFKAKMQYYRANLDKVIKIQSLFRAKDTREQYRQLTLGKNVNVGTIKNFVHLLDDSEADFEDEIEVERLRKRVVENIRENQALETDVNELDVKIALVVQNVKSSEELIKARRRHGADSAAAHASRASVLAAHGDPFAGPNALDHATKRKLELYQQLFYLLQTQGEYLSRLFFRLSRVEIPEKSKRLAERVVLTLFGYGQDRREDFLLLKLFQMAVQEELKAAPTIADIIHGHPMYINLAVHYVRPKQVAFVRDTLQTVIKDIIEEDDLDLVTDPCVIYRSRINVEEMRSGTKSTKPLDITFHQAVEDPETRGEFIRHLQKLHALTKVFMTAITSSTKKMPYGIRCIARETLQALRTKFPHESEAAHAACIGRLIYYRYINPAILNPETFDVVPGTVGVAARKNLSEISKMLSQIASGTVFGEDVPALTPLNTYVTEAIQQMSTWFLEVADVSDAETQFHAHEFLDATVQPKPIYISPNEVYSMHSLLSQHLEHLAPTRDDLLRTILIELGGAPNLGNDELKDARDRAITLELTNRFANVKDPHADEKALWVQAKRGVLAILRVQPAKDLVESLMQPVADEHEMFWEDIVDREMLTDRMRQRQRRMPSTTGADSAYRLEDIRSLSFREVKAHAIYFLLELEKRGKVTRSDGYQGILNAIAGDVRSKHRKRLQRQQELSSMNEALSHLAERKKYFEEQISSYHNYVEAAMNTMQRGKGKKRFVMPFTKQFFHLRDLQRSGQSPQFGSFRYSAHDLYDKGILLSIDQYSPRQFDRIDFVLSSNKAGIFTISVYNTSLGSSSLMFETDIRMEDLLQSQFENRVSLALFDGQVKVNLNLLLYQINKKFYV